MTDALSIPTFAKRRGKVRGGSFVSLCGDTDLAVAFGMGIELAFAQGDNAKAPEWVQLLPAGPTIVARDGRKWTLKDPAVVVAAFKAGNVDLAFDINHASEILGPKGGDAPAQGWIKDMEVRDGLLWGRVEWTAAGAAKVEGKEYRYVSPAIRHDRSGNVTGLASAALVTHPALDMPALARDEGQHPKDPSMTLLARAAAALGLAATATEDQVVEAIGTQVSLARDTRDPSKFVPAADLSTALARAQTAEDALQARIAADAEAAATTLVDGAIDDGKIAPASRDHWLGLAREKPAEVTAILGGMPKVVGDPVLDRKPEGGGEHGLTAEQLELCSLTGTDPVAFATTLKEEGAAR